MDHERARHRKRTVLQEKKGSSSSRRRDDNKNKDDEDDNESDNDEDEEEDSVKEEHRESKPTSKRPKRHSKITIDSPQTVPNMTRTIRLDPLLDYPNPLHERNDIEWPLLIGFAIIVVIIAGGFVWVLITDRHDHAHVSL